MLIDIASPSIPFALRMNNDFGTVIGYYRNH
jgi:hypothetical protein